MAKQAAFKHVLDKGFERLVGTEETPEKPKQASAKAKKKKTQPWAIVRWWRHLMEGFHRFMYYSGVIFFVSLIGFSFGAGDRLMNYIEKASGGTIVAEAPHHAQVAHASEASTGTFAAATVEEEAPMPTGHLNPAEVYAAHHGYARHAPRALHEPAPAAPNSETRSQSQHD